MKGKITESEYKAVEATCGNWHEISLKAAHAHLVEGMRQADAAKHFGITTQRMNNLQARFMGKVTIHRMHAFVQENIPASQRAPTDELELYRNEIKGLSGASYTDHEITDYLSSLGVKTTSKEVGEVIRGKNHE